MPKRDGTGPLGLGPSRRGGCQGRGFFQRGMLSNGGGNTAAAASYEDLESKAKQLEEQAAKLRDLATQKKKI